MNESEIIRLLKNNKEAFCLMDPEMQAWAKEHRESMLRLSVIGKWEECSYLFGSNDTYRLRPVSKKEPERMEIEIVLSRDGNFNVLKDHNLEYDRAAAFIPQKGYRFIGFRYEQLGDDFRAETLVWIGKDGCLGFHPEDGYVPTMPITAVYERGVK